MCRELEKKTIKKIKTNNIKVLKYKILKNIGIYVLTGVELFQLKNCVSVLWFIEYVKQKYFYIFSHKNILNLTTYINILAVTYKQDYFCFSYKNNLIIPTYKEIENFKKKTKMILK